MSDIRTYYIIQIASGEVNFDELVEDDWAAYQVFDEEFRDAAISIAETLDAVDDAYWYRVMTVCSPTIIWNPERE